MADEIERALKTVETRARRTRELIAELKALDATERSQAWILLNQKVHAPRATRDQAIRAAREKGALVSRIADAAGLSQGSTSTVIAKGPFGRKRASFGPAPVEHAAAVTEAGDDEQPQKPEGKCTFKHDVYELKIYDKKGKHAHNTKWCKHCGYRNYIPAEHRGRAECSSCGNDVDRKLH